VIVAGLTGSIAMGKSTVGRMFAELGAPVFDADAAVREYYRSEESEAVEAAFPGVRIDGEVDRGRLAAATLGDPPALRRLEAIVHPDVARRRLAFLAQSAAAGRRVAVVDVPLLFETGGEKTVDLVVVVSAGAEAQRMRALSRPDMTDAKLEAILARQTPDAEKRRRAHWVIDTRGPYPATRAQVAAVLRALAAVPGRRPIDA
jgi:dephospho-CoA kinase